MVELDEYLNLRERPAGQFAMLQSWRDLSFLHFAIDPQEIRHLIPEALQLDTFPDASGAEKAWIGLVPFWMTGIRSRGLPRIPGAHTFPETNVRTYVHCEGKGPGVWFFSLDASNRLACQWARTFFGLNYQWARMLAKAEGSMRFYRSERVARPSERCNVTLRIGPDLDPPQPGTVEFFLVERYLLYAVRRGVLYTGRVHHSPYPLQGAEIESLDETLVQAAGIQARPCSHVLYSPGVDVRVFPLQKVASIGSSRPVSLLR